MALNERLKEARIQANMTQQQLGELIGVAKSTITGYEKGNSEPDMNKLSKILACLGVDANFVFQDEMRKLNQDDETDDTFEAVKDNYSLLNTEGKEKILSYAQDLVSTGLYKKTNQSDMGKNA